MSDAPTPAAGPLAGVKILDLTRLLPGPMCTLHLADMGADVVKVEDTGAGDYAAAPVRALLNRNKRGLRLDLKHPPARAAFLALVDGADVLVESFRPGVMARLGLGPEVLLRRRPRLVYCSLSGYGQTGPGRDAAGHDLNYCAVAGVADQVGADADTPALPNLPLADLMGGALTAAMAILAALFDAQRSGRGRHLDVAMADGVLAHAVLPLGTLNAHGHTRRAGADHLSGGLACYAQYATRDGRHLAVGALEPKFWAALCTALGRPDLLARHRSGDPATEAATRAELAALFATRTQAEWVAALAGVDACVSPVLRLEESLADPQFLARGMVVRPDSAGVVPPADAARQPPVQFAFPVRMSDFEFRVRRPAPRPGEHGAELLREAGLDPAAIAAALGEPAPPHPVPA
ncbi:CaiB/BaiF CoA transferase family protein [Piscinibacter sakaiensis]|uniref:Alpha-methylacyl-CoA racemase n=1 Tax=Piscinibacter sakaiensis TaxID=1547922 RepID=A0A0K8P3K0_PISS1|nr:CaiB/BaiF CoA-transferase family protein [Piscinibacter sakaiensis]GAP37208.1 alpha-methylacyl-CoA racemase [Piscinibacter sakaiensis]